MEPNPSSTDHVKPADPSDAVRLAVCRQDYGTRTEVWMEEWTDTYAEACRRIGSYLSDARCVIFDDTNFMRCQRDQLRAIADTQSAVAHVVHIAVPEAEARRRWTLNRITHERGDVRDDDFVYVAKHFEPPASDEAAITCDSAQSVHEWIDLVGLHLKLL